MRRFARSAHDDYVRWFVVPIAAASVCLFVRYPVAFGADDLEIAARDLPWAIVDRPYAPLPLEVLDGGRCPVGGLGFATISGALPPGMRLTRAGYLTGTPSKIGHYWFAVRVANGCSKATRWMDLVVSGAPLLQVSPERVRFVSDDGPLRPQPVRVSASWPKLEYQVSIRSGKEWLKATPRRGVTPKAGDSVDADVLELVVDPKGLKAGFYRGEVVISAWGALDAPVIKVELVVGRAESGGRESVNQR